MTGREIVNVILAIVLFLGVLGVGYAALTFWQLQNADIGPDITNGHTQENIEIEQETHMDAYDNTRKYTAKASRSSHRVSNSYDYYEEHRMLANKTAEQVHTPPNDKPPEEYSRQDVKELIRDVFGHKADSAIAIADCESELYTLAFNGDDPHGGSVGIFQINGAHGNLEDFYDPETNVEFAYELSNGGINFSDDWVICSQKTRVP